MKNRSNRLSKPAKRKITVRVPASSGNIGPGFDVLGLALNLSNDLHVRVLKSAAGSPRIHVKGEGAQQLPTNRSNVVFRALSLVFRRARRKLPTLELVCRNRIPLARGLGSSSAAIVSGLLAGNRLLGNRFSKEEILEMATELEGHPDNAAPAIFGGVQASTIIDKNVIVARWPVPRARVVVAVPEFKLSTKKARSVLPKKISMKDAISNLASVALLQQAFIKDKSNLKYLLNDRWHEPYRARLIKGFSLVKKAALKAGALGVTLSGAGPTMLSFVEASRVKRVGNAMKKAFLRKGVRCRIMSLGINHKGADVR